MSELSQLIASSVDAPAFFDKDSKKGDTVAINITAIALRQTLDVKRKSPEVWGDGSPKQQLVITGEVAGSSNPERMGTRATLYVKWWGNQRKRFATAIVDAGTDEPRIGGFLRVTYVGDGPKPDDKALSAEKLYEYEYGIGNAEQEI